METTGNTGHEALTDFHTGLPNNLHWDTVLGIIFAAGARGIPLTVIMLGIDRYEQWLEKQDEASVELAFSILGEVLRSTTRQSDLAARTREESFAFLLLDCNLAGGRLVVDRLDGLFDPIRQQTGMSFSFGVATFNPRMSRPEDLIDAAEEALKTAQARGENQIEFHG